jgi:NitT/TauT family transport system substrate-binding protein
MFFLSCFKGGKASAGRMGILAVVLLFLMPGWGAAGERPLKKATFLPQWVPQAQFAGYYTALEKGIYRNHGIDLAILPGGPGRSPGECLERGTADFTTLWLATGIEMRAKGVPLVNIAQILQQSALMLVAMKSSGIEKPEDMEGRKVGLWGAVFRIQPAAFFRKFKLNVVVVPQSFSVDLFLRGGVAVASAMWYNEYHTILNAGVDPEELTPFFFQDYGLNYPEDGIYVLEKTFDRDPDLCRAFVDATLEGWRYAFDHPDEAVAIILGELEKANIPATRVHQRWMLDRMKDLMVSRDNPDLAAGSLLPEDYHRVAHGLKAFGLIETVPPFTEFYRVCGNERP